MAEPVDHPPWSTTGTQSSLVKAIIPSTTLPAQPCFSVVNPDGSSIGAGGAADVNLRDGSGNPITSTVDGLKRLLDVNLENVHIDVGHIEIEIPTANSKDYYEGTITSVDTVLAFAFGAKELTIFNDGLVTIYYEHGAIPVVGTSPKMFAGEIMVDNYESNNLHLITVGADTALVRVWARG